MTSFHHYLPIDNTLFHDGFYVTGAGRTHVAPGVGYPPKAHPPFYHFTWTEGRILPEFAIIFVTRGKGVFESGESGLRFIKPGNVILLFPGIWHRYRPDHRTGWTEKWIQFNGEFVHKLWDRDLISTKQQVLKSSRFREIDSALEVLLTQIEQRPGFNSLRYALQVSHILDLVINTQSVTSQVASACGTPSSQEGLVSAARNYIWTHSQLALSVGDIATHLGVSRRMLERKFRAAQSRTISQEIAHCRFNRAKRLLQETNLAIKKVVYLAGFGRAENMRQEFIKHNVPGPRAYRAKRERINCGKSFSSR